MRARARAHANGHERERERERVTLLAGNCLDVLPTLATASIDAMVTDPPAGIDFMGQAWDRFTPTDFREAMATVFHACFRTLKPGAHALVWALPRTSHWTASALEDAGFDVRDVITHHFGVGFPKSHNLDGDWEGWGTALKPASEHWILCRRVLDGTVAENVARHGTGALNIDGARVRVNGDRPLKVRTKAEPGVTFGEGLHGSAAAGTTNEGRWPANVILSHAPECVELAGTRKVRTGTSGIGNGEKTVVVYGRWRRRDFMFTHGDANGLEEIPLYACVPHCPVRQIDDQSGFRRPGAIPARANHERSKASVDFSGRNGHLGGRRLVLDGGGGASRFFYVPKASTKERNAGLEARNTHPTVKAVALMRYLCRLITPPDGLILDPFAGTGSTGIAALLEGFRFVGIEREAEYVAIAKKRLRAAAAEAAEV
jgi:site-specific DNA-methyltransferase (adenine-specific)